MPFWIDFWSILPSNLFPKILWNVSKIDAKMHSILDSMFGSIFGSFLLPIWIPWTQFGTSGLVPNAFFRVFWEIDVWSHVGANLVTFWHPKPGGAKLVPESAFSLMLQAVFYEKLNQKSSKNQLKCRHGMSWSRLGGVLGRLLLDFCWTCLPKIDSRTLKNH